MINDKIKFLYPNFLRRIDRYLLLNYPHVWRTRAHEFAWFSLILGNVLALLLGLWMAATDYALVPYSFGGLLMDMSITHPTYFSLKLAKYLFCFIVLLWALKLRQFKMQSINYRHVLLTWFIYLGCLLSLHSNIASFIVGNAVGVATYNSPPTRHLYADSKLFKEIHDDRDCFAEGSKPYLRGPLKKECFEKITGGPLERYADLIDTEAPLERRDFNTVLRHLDVIIKARKFLDRPFQKIQSGSGYAVQTAYYQYLLAGFFGLFLFSMLFIPMLLFLITDFKKSGLLLLVFPILFFLFILKSGNPFYNSYISYLGILALLIFYSLVATAAVYGYLKQKYLPAAN